MGAPEMYSEAYADHLTGDPVYDKAFAALADCPSFAQVEQALKTYAHDLAEWLRRANIDRSDEFSDGVEWAADFIDPDLET